MDTASLSYYRVKRKGQWCGHTHRSERELALCWRKRGEVWEINSKGAVLPVTEATQLARIRAFVPRPVRGRPKGQTPRIAQARPLYVRGISADEMLRYDTVALLRGYGSMQDYVRALLRQDADAAGAEVARMAPSEEVATRENSRGK